MQYCILKHCIMQAYVVKHEIAQNALATFGTLEIKMADGPIDRKLELQSNLY